MFLLYITTTINHSKIPYQCNAMNCIGQIMKLLCHSVCHTQR